MKDNQFYLPVRLHLDRGNKFYTKLLHWLNIQHCGKKIPPENASKEHVDATWDMHRIYVGEMLCELQKDGTYIPVSFKFGENYKFVENEKDS